MKPLKNTCVVLAFASLLFSYSSCKTTDTLLSSTQYSESAHATDLAIKTQSLALIDRAKSRTPYSAAATGVDQLTTKIDQAIAVEQRRTKNEPTIAQWKKIRTQLSSLFNLWKTKGSVSPSFAESAKSQMAGLFDILIKTEEDKRPHS